MVLVRLTDTMEPIVSVLKVDKFHLGIHPGPKTYPRGTLLRLDSGRVADGGYALSATPLGLLERETGERGGAYELSTMRPTGKQSMRLGNFIHSPNSMPGVQSSNLVIHFTPYADADKLETFNMRLVILAEPITVGDSANPIVGHLASPFEKIAYSGPVYISAAVGGVVDLNWPFDEYPNTFKFDKVRIDDAYAGKEVYLIEEPARVYA